MMKPGRSLFCLAALVCLACQPDNSERVTTGSNQGSTKMPMGGDPFANARHSFDPPPSVIREEELRELEQAVRNAPDDPEAHLRLAKLLKRGNRRQEALKHLIRAAELSPGDPKAKLELALGHANVAQLGEAETIYRELMEIPQYRPVALHNLGNLETRRDRLDRAIEYYRQAVAIRPDYILANYHLGLALLQQGHQSAAYETFTTVLQAQPPTDPSKQLVYFDAAYRVATVDLTAGDNEHAVRVLSELLKHYPDHPNAMYAYGRALRAMGHEEEARRVFERHMELPDRTMGRTAWVGSPAFEAGIEQPVFFRDVAVPAGIQIRNVCGEPAGQKNWITEGMCGGAGWLDYDGDGILDVYLTNGSKHHRAPGTGEPNQLFRGDGRGGFENVTEQAGVGDRGWGYGVGVGDVDNDGDPDLYVANYGPNVLYRNNGDGTFTDVTARAGVGADGWSSSVAFFDLEGDGDLDLYVGNYLEMDPEVVPKLGESEFCIFKGIHVFCGPKPLVPQHDVLYRNNGDGTFSDVSVESGIFLDEPRYTLGVVAGDYDNDGLTDVYVANDSVNNSLWRNLGDGRMHDEGVLSLSAVSVEGRAQSGMGTNFGDYDGDGWLDLAVTNFSHDLNTIYRNVEGKYFDDETSAGGLSVTGPALSWGVGFVDFDNDSDLDLFIANGHLHPEMDEFELGTTYRQANHLFLNDSRGRFVEVGRNSGPGLEPLRSFRGAAFADYDNDGDIDVLATSLDEEAFLLNNQTPGIGRFLVVGLVGTRSNRDGIGARLLLRVGDRTLMRQRLGGGSFLNESDPRVHFGLGHAEKAERLEVIWPSGTIDVVEDLAANQFLTITEGQGAELSDRISAAGSAR
jgi:Flp pilus assembly protein TadD